MPKDSTKQYYENCAEKYFNQTYLVDLENLWAKLIHHLEPQACILDLGCGSGRDLRYFGKQGFNAIGLDYAVNLSKLAKDFSRQPITVADLNFPPFRRDSFDAVWAIGSLLHIHRQSISHVLTQIHKILRLEGILLTSIKKGLGENVDIHGRYTAFYQSHGWENVLTSNGFDVIQIEETKEIRQMKSNQQQEIWWITCLAKAV